MTSIQRQLGALGQSEVASSGPYFIPDIYEGDMAAPNFSAIAVQPSVVGCILKATDGLAYSPAWFTNNWNRVRAAGGARYGDSWFRGCYHFGRPNAHGAAQADFLLGAVQRAGGWGDGDMPPAWDLEGSSWASNSNQQIVDISSQFSARIRDRIGKSPILYAGSLIRDRGITDRMGFDKLWTPQINMQAARWPVSDYALWQYAGDGGGPRGYDLRANYPGAFAFPLALPGWTRSDGYGTDMNVVMDNGRPASSIGSVRSILTGGSGILLPLVIGGALFTVAFALYQRFGTSRSGS